MQKGGTRRKIRKSQHQSRPGSEKKMRPQPVFDYPDLPGSNKLKNKIAFITGGDSGIGKAVAILFAKEGADIAIAYLNEHSDAKDTKKIIEEQYGKKCLLIPGDISRERNCIAAVNKTIKEYQRVDILVNNAAKHYEHKTLDEISTKKLIKTFELNIFLFLDH
jgi:NAD(P)-dependent dehydrogenase (short-subunit alcohol dehydrogenase family)